MGILDSIRLLYCLNESGIAKAHDLLSELINNQQHTRVSLEQLYEETDKIKQEAESKFQKENEIREQRKIEEQQKLRREFESELRMIGNITVPLFETYDIFKAINRLSDQPIMKIRNAYAWGYIQGKRAERARRKKVSHE